MDVPQKSKHLNGRLSNSCSYLRELTNENGVPKSHKVLTKDMQSTPTHLCTGKRKRRTRSSRNRALSNGSTAALQHRKTSPTRIHHTQNLAPVELNRSLSEDHCFGISKSLSTESIKNACGFYSDEMSDEDLMDIQSMSYDPEKQRILAIAAMRRSFKLKNIEGKDKNANVSANRTPQPSYVNSDTDLASGFDGQSSVDPTAVLEELDTILDIYGDSVSSHLNTSSSFSCEMDDTKIEDCLLDLDKYLEEMDDCSVQNFENEDKSAEQPGSLRRKLTHKMRRNRTLPKSMNRKSDTINLSAIADDFLVNDTTATANENWQRGHELRKTISYGDERKLQDHTTTEAPTLATLWTWRRNPSQETEFTLLPGTESTSSCEQLSANQRQQSDKSTVHMNPTAPTPTNVSPPLGYTVRLPPPNNQQPANSPQPEMLTQEDIFHNFLVENTTSNELLDSRPRQFGRRVEGHPSVLSLRTDLGVGLDSSINNCTLINYDQRPVSAPAAAAGRHNRQHTVRLSTPEREQPPSILYIGSEASSLRSSRNGSPVSLVSSTDSSSTTPSTGGNIESNLVTTEISGNPNGGISQPENTTLDPEISQQRLPPGFNSEWPHLFSRTLALVCCTLGLFNICRFAVLTINFGGNFLLQFLLLSIIFGIPLFWLQLCLGAKIKAGPVSMWKISPICRGVGIALVLLQCLIAIYSTVVIAWLLVYLRDSFPTKTIPSSLYRWQLINSPYRHITNNTANITECVADYFNIVVLQRLQFANRGGVHEYGFRVNDRLAFSLFFLWATVFIILCKGLKSFGKAVYVLGTLPLIALIVVTCKFLYVVDPTKLQNIFTSGDFDDFLINSKTWAAAAQEVFLTWGLLGPSVISIASRKHAKGNTKTTLRRDAILVVLITLLGLTVAALLGLSCLEILNQQQYVYKPGSFERPESYTAVYSLQSAMNTEMLSTPVKWLPHYSSFIGETYRFPNRGIHSESGYQALRFITELLPVVVALGRDSISWVWTAVTFFTLIIFGLAQLCAMWKPISCALGNSTSSVLLSCVTGLLLSIPFATEVGISILHFMDLLLGGAWFIPLLWTALIFGVFLVRGRPYNGDDLVNDLKMTASMSAFLALSWNVLLPIGLIALTVVEYKISLSSQFYYWRGRAYFSFWTRKVAALTQTGFLLLVPITAIVQIYRYMTKGPADILDRMQLLYRPCEEVAARNRGAGNGRNRGNHNSRLQNGGTGRESLDLGIHHLQDDAPPKYTPPPSYTTATGARLAKLFRQSMRHSVRRILGGASRTRPIISSDTEMNQQSLPPDYSTVLTSPSGNTSIQTDTCSLSATTEIDGSSPANDMNNATNAQRAFSLGRKASSQKHGQTLVDFNHRRPASASRATETRCANLRRPFTAEDVVHILRSSTRTRSHRVQPNSNALSAAAAAAQTAADQYAAALHADNIDNSFRSIENLILNAEPLGQSPAVATLQENEDDMSIGEGAKYDERNNSSVI